MESKKTMTGIVVSIDGQVAVVDYQKTSRTTVNSFMLVVGQEVELEVRNGRAELSESFAVALDNQFIENKRRERDEAEAKMEAEYSKTIQGKIDSVKGYASLASDMAKVAAKSVQDKAPIVVAKATAAVNTAAKTAAPTVARLSGKVAKNLSKDTLGGRFATLKASMQKFGAEFKEEYEKAKNS